MTIKAFSRAAVRREVPSDDDFLAAILRERPDLKGQTVDETEYGDVSHTIFIGDEVFKTPKPEFASEFARECKVQKKLYKKGLPVPEVTYVGKKAIFLGMKRIPGVELIKVLGDLTPEQQRTLVTDIVDFMIDMARALPLEEGRMFAFHADMHQANIFVDPETRKLTGIIDYGIVEHAPKEQLCHPRVSDLADIIREEYERRKDEVKPTPVQELKYQAHRPVKKLRHKQEITAL